MSVKDNPDYSESGVDYVVDAVGLICPEPVMMLHNAVRDAEPLQVIKVVATDPSTKKDIKQFCAFLGHELVDQREEGEKILHYLKKGGSKS